MSRKYEQPRALYCGHTQPRCRGQWLRLAAISALSLLIGMLLGALARGL
jgi:hypothetical protein